MRQKATFLLLFLSICFSTLFSCVSKERNQAEEVENSAEVEKANKEKVKKIKKIFYSLPSPLELTLLFRDEGVSYDKNRLHPTERRDDYLTSTKKALSLGVYGADLSYAGLFGEHQDAIQYFTATHLIAADIGIEQTFQKEFISRLENNANDKDTLLTVIGEFFLNNDRYLKNHDQKDLSYYVLAGGWIEGMYLGTTMADTSNSTQGIRKVIASQRSSLDNLVSVLTDLRVNPEVADIVVSIEELSVLFSQLPKSSDGEEELILDDSNLLVIKDKVADIRGMIVERSN